MERSVVLFPSDFERLYNLPFEYADQYAGQRHSVMRPAFDEVDPERVYRHKDEISKAMHRSLIRKREIARGGDLLTKEGQKLGRILVQKRGEDYAQRGRTAVVPSAPMEMPLDKGESIASDIEYIVMNLRNLVETGAITGELYTGANKLLQSLLKEGNFLTAQQLQEIYADVGDIIGYFPTFNLAQVTTAQKQIVNATSLLIDTIRRSLQYLIKYANYSPKDRKSVMPSLRKEVQKYVRRSEFEGGQPRIAVGLRQLVAPGRAGARIQPYEQLQVRFGQPLEAVDLEEAPVPAI